MEVEGRGGVKWGKICKNVDFLCTYINEQFFILGEVRGGGEALYPGRKSIFM